MPITKQQFASIKPGDYVLLNRWTELPLWYSPAGGMDHLNGTIEKVTRKRDEDFSVEPKNYILGIMHIAAIKRSDSHEWEYEVNGHEYQSLSLPTVLESFPECMRDGERTRFSCFDSDGVFRVLTESGYWMGRLPHDITPVPASPSPERLREIAAAEAEVERMEAHLAERKTALKAMKEGE